MIFFDVLWREDGFLRGFLVGQITSFLVLLFFIRFFLFASPSNYVHIRPKVRESFLTIKTIRFLRGGP